MIENVFVLSATFCMIAVTFSLFLMSISWFIEDHEDKIMKIYNSYKAKKEVEGLLRKK